MKCVNPDCYNDTELNSTGTEYKKYCCDRCRNVGRVANMKTTFTERYGREWVLNLSPEERKEALEFQKNNVSDEE